MKDNYRSGPMWYGNTYTTINQDTVDRKIEEVTAWAKKIQKEHDFMQEIREEMVNSRDFSSTRIESYRCAIAYYPGTKSSMGAFSVNGYNPYKDFGFKLRYNSKLDRWYLLLLNRRNHVKIKAKFNALSQLIEVLNEALMFTVIASTETVHCLNKLKEK